MSVDTKRIPGLDFGTLDLPSRRGPLLNGQLRFDVMANDVELGAAEAVTTIVESLMLDGDDERIDRYGNREITFRVKITGATPDIAGHGELLLGLQTGRRNTLVYTPRDSGSVPTKWILTTSRMEPEFKLWNELKSVRIYKVTIRALPWSFSMDDVTVIGAPTGAAPVVVDPATSAAAWSAAGHTKSAVTYESETAIRFERIAGAAGFPYIEWTGAVPGTPYVAIDVTCRSISSGDQELYPPLGVDLFAGGIVGVEERPNGWRRLYYETSEVQKAGGLGFRLSVNTDLYDVYVGGLLSAAAPASAGTMVFEVQGSARTPATIDVDRTAMDWCFVYSDPTMLEFGWSPGNLNTWVYAPTGRYVLHCPGANLLKGDLVEITTPGVGVIRNRIARDGDPLGIVDLGGTPEGRLGTTAYTSIQINGAVLSGPQVFMFRISDHGETALTYDRNAGNSLLIQPPTLQNRFGGVWTDNQASTADWEFVKFGPPVTAIFIACANYIADPPVTTVTYTPAFQTFASRVRKTS